LTLWSSGRVVIQYQRSTCHDRISDAICRSIPLLHIYRSHADMDHIGSLPIVFGRLGLGGVPVICTTPVSKFGKMILYDFCLNKEMEGSHINNGSTQQRFELDDIDLALSNVTTVKYSQTIHLPGVSESVGE
jgi:Cft2 family RNA processing exonuclease